MTSGERLRALLSLHDAASGAAVLAESPRVRVTRVPFDELSDAVCKEDRGARLRSRLGRALRGSRAARAQAAARALQTAGFDVPEPLGLLELPGRALGVARHVAGPTLQQALAEASPELAAGLAVAAATLAARLHAAGFACRDLKPPNLVVASCGLVLVDLDDVTGPRRLSRRFVARNLAALDAYAQRLPRPLSARSRWAALVAYALLRDQEPRDLLGPVLTLSRRKRRRWAREAARGA